MKDSVVLFSEATVNLGRAYNAYQGSSFMKYFAAKLLPNLTPEQRSMRLTILRMGGELVETEFEEAMDVLANSWKEYRKATNAVSG